MEAFPVPIPLPVQRPPFTYKGKLKDYKISTDKRCFIWSFVCLLMSNYYEYKSELKDYKIWCYQALIWSSVYFFAILIDMPSPPVVRFPSVAIWGLLPPNNETSCLWTPQKALYHIQVRLLSDHVMKMLIYDDNDNGTSCLLTAEGSILYSGKIIFWSS